MAGYAAQLEQYQKAIDIYEQVGTARALGEGPAPHHLHSAPSLPLAASPLPSITILALPLSSLAKQFTAHNPTGSPHPLPVCF